jgi:hypothetical protein
MTDEIEPVSLRDLHGARLIHDDGDGSEEIVNFTCSEHPDCDVCGDLEDTGESEWQNMVKREKHGVPV